MDRRSSRSFSTNLTGRFDPLWNSGKYQREAADEIFYNRINKMKERMLNEAKSVITEIIIECTCGTRMVAGLNSYSASNLDRMDRIIDKQMIAEIYKRVVVLTYVGFDKPNGFEVFSTQQSHSFFVEPADATQTQSLGTQFDCEV